MAFDLAGLLPNPFGLPSQGIWNLQKGSFTNSAGDQVVFFVENSIGQFPQQFTAIDTATDTAGRRLAVYNYPYVSGQAIQDLGRQGERFVMNIKFYGSNHQILFKSFIETVTKVGGKGTLNHPVRGTFPAQFLQYDFVYSYREWNAVTIRATFLEDNTNQISNLNIFDSINSALRTGLQTLSTVNSLISTTLGLAAAVVGLPAALLNGLKSSLLGIVANTSSLFGQLAASFSSDIQLQNLFASAAANGGVLNVNTGTTPATTTSPSSQLPPVYQVGFSAADQANINANTSSFVNANQVTTQQALFSANLSRAQISQAIKDVTSALGNNGYQVVLYYRILANSIQNATQAAVTSIQTQVVVYTVPTPMSLRKVAFLNGLAADRQNDIAVLNPYISSINYVLAGTILQLPST